MMSAVRMRAIAVAFGMQVIASALALAPCGVARAQMDLDGGLGGLGGFITPAALQTLLIYQLYGMQQQQFNALPEAQRTAMQNEMAKRAADYFTNGAEATGVPTAGPAAAYFTNGAEVTAANTANTVPYGESAFAAPPEIGADASAASASAPPSAPEVDAAQPPDAASAASPRARAGADAGPSSPSPPESTATTAWATPPSPSEPEAAGPSGAVASVTLRQPTEDQGILGSTSWLAPVYAHLSFRWVWPTMAGLSLGAFALFLALRSR
jgi:hypothetical protein